MFEAQRQWFKRLGEFSHFFRYQYVISKQREDLEGFAHHPFGDLHLHCGRDLPTHALHDETGAPIGYVIGIAVGPEGEIVDASSRLPLRSGADGFWTALEGYIIETAGRFAFIVNNGDEKRLYTDPIGMIGAVYSKHDGYVAASPLMCIKREVEPDPLFDFDIIRNHGGKLSLFHTADRHVRRMNPSTFLDLTSLEETRFWPRDEKFAPAPQNPRPIYEEIKARASANIGAVAHAFLCSFPISGGQDSRLLLAFAQEHRDDVDQFFTHVNNWATKRDAAIAKKLCKISDVPHEIHDKGDFSVSHKEARQMTRAFQITSGAESQPPREYLSGIVQGLTESNVVLRGHQTDLLRAVYVFKPKERWAEAGWQIERLLIVPRNMFSQETVEKYEGEFKAWQDTLPKTAWDKAADFMFLEIYYNSTLGAMFPALWRNFYMSPFNSRKLIELSLQFGERDRRFSVPVYDIIQSIDPDLGAVPFDFEVRGPLEDFDQRDDFEEFTGKRVHATQQRLQSYDALADDLVAKAG